MSNNNLEEIENLLEKARKKSIIQEAEQNKAEVDKNTYVLSDEEKTEIEKEYETDESSFKFDEEERKNNEFVQHLLKEGKRRNEVKLAPPIEIEGTNNI